MLQYEWARCLVATSIRLEKHHWQPAVDLPPKHQCSKQRQLHSRSLLAQELSFSQMPPNHYFNLVFVFIKLAWFFTKIVPIIVQKIKGTQVKLLHVRKSECFPKRSELQRNFLRSADVENCV